MRDNQEMLDSLGGLIAIESVAGPGCSEQEPFGPGPAAALDYMLKLCGELGFQTKNCGGRVGWAEIGQGEEMVGILCHLDVVPAGTGWDYPPYAMTVVGDRAYGYILLEIPGGPDELAKAVNFLRQTPDVTVQVQVDYAAKEGQA